MTAAIALMVMLSIAASAFAGSGSEPWGYGAGGGLDPKKWAKHSPKCGKSRQSPIDIITNDVTKDDKLEPLNVTYSHYGGMLTGLLTNNGHAPKFNIIGGHATLKGGEYTLEQFHVHFGCGNQHGSEHKINGRQFPAELHLVFYKTKYGCVKDAASKPDGLTVIGVFLETNFTKCPGGFFSPELSHLSWEMSLISEKDAAIGTMIVMENLVGGLSSGLLPYYNYKGSLTTPPCFESVNWIVLKDPVYIPDIELGMFQTLQAKHGGEKGLMCNNFRPTQKLNGRKVSVYEPEDCNLKNNR